jgi:hypothetical protein
MSREWKRDELIEAIAAGAFDLAAHPELNVTDVAKKLTEPDEPLLGRVCVKGWSHDGPCEYAPEPEPPLHPLLEEES